MSNAEQISEVLGPIFVGGEKDVDGELIDEMVGALRPLTDPDLTCVMSGAEHVELTYEGLDGLRRAWGDWLEAFARVRFEVIDVEQVGENVVTLARQIGTTRHGGVEIEQPSAAVWKFRDDNIVRIEFHLDRERAAESAGRPAE